MVIIGETEVSEPEGVATLGDAAKEALRDHLRRNLGGLESGGLALSTIHD